MEYKLQLLHAYDPASSHNNEKVNHLYEDIGLSLKKKKSILHYSLGRLDAKVGRKLIGREEAIGNYVVW